MTYEIIRKLLNEAIKVQADEQTHEGITLNTKVFIEDDDDDDEGTYSVDNGISYIHVRDSLGNYSKLFKNAEIYRNDDDICLSINMMEPDGA